jgi:hypothetical protein
MFKKFTKSKSSQSKGTMKKEVYQKYNIVLSFGILNRISPQC